jgi:hypothetical protein
MIYLEEFRRKYSRRSKLFKVIDLGINLTWSLENKNIKGRKGYLSLILIFLSKNTHY